MAGCGTHLPEASIAWGFDEMGKPAVQLIEVAFRFHISNEGHTALQTRNAVFFFGLIQIIRPEFTSLLPYPRYNA